MCTEKVLVVPKHKLVAADCRNKCRVTQQLAEYISIHARAGVDADGLLQAVRGVARVFEGLPRAFQKNTLLGIEYLGFTRGHPEKSGVEIIRLSDRRVLRNKIRI